MKLEIEKVENGFILIHHGTLLRKTIHPSYEELFNAIMDLNSENDYACRVYKSSEITYADSHTESTPSPSTKEI